MNVLLDLHVVQVRIGPVLLIITHYYEGHRVGPGGSSSQHNENVHVRSLVSQSFEATHVKTGPQEELDHGGQTTGQKGVERDTIPPVVGCYEFWVSVRYQPYK